MADIDQIIDEMDAEGGHDHFSTSRAAVRAAIERALEDARAGHVPAPPVTRTFVGIDPGDPESEPAVFSYVNGAIVADGGWRAPSEFGSLLQELVAIPEISVARGPLVTTEPGEIAITPEPAAETRRLHFGSGHWEYGIDVADYADGDTKPEIVASEYIFEHSPFLTVSSALESDHWTEGCKLMKRWVPDRGPWKDAER